MNNKMSPIKIYETGKYEAVHILNQEEVEGKTLEEIYNDYWEETEGDCGDLKVVNHETGETYEYNPQNEEDTED